MTTAKPVGFYQTKLLEDVAAIAGQGKGYLVTVEHTRQLAPAPFRAPAEKTGWRFWQLGPEGDFREVSRATTVMPVASAVVMTVQKNRLIALAQVNEPVPAFVLSWEITGSPPRLADSVTEAEPLRLDPDTAAQVRLDPTEIWNTRGLPAYEWLFHPSLAPLPDGDDVVFAMNTAKGHAAVWRSNDEGPARRPRVFLAAALNPVFARVSDKSFLLYRQMPPTWLVYNKDPRYSGHPASPALPLIMAELNDSGGVVRSHDLSKDQSVGDVLAFAADSAGNRLVLAVIAGAMDKLQLRVYSSEGAGGNLRLQQAVPLAQIPYRLTMAAVNGGALIGLSYSRAGVFEVEGMMVPLQ
jgi:hypothetical protein